MTNKQTLTLVALLTLGAGSCLPWVSVFGINVSGLEGDGVVTLFFAAVGLVLFVLHRRGKFKPKTVQITGIVLAALSLLIGLNALTNFAAIGLYLTILGAGAWLGVAISELRSTPTTANAPDGPRAGD